MPSSYLVIRGKALCPSFRHSRDPVRSDTTRDADLPRRRASAIDFRAKSLFSSNVGFVLMALPPYRAAPGPSPEP